LKKSFSHPGQVDFTLEQATFSEHLLGWQAFTHSFELTEIMWVIKIIQKM